MGKARRATNGSAGLRTVAAWTNGLVSLAAFAWAGPGRETSPALPPLVLPGGQRSMRQRSKPLTEGETEAAALWSIRALGFEFVSDFEIRISCFSASLLPIPGVTVKGAPDRMQLQETVSP
jgi:hypothetical protein